MNSSRLPAPIDCRLLLYLSHLHINCIDNVSFHRIIAFLSSIFGQLTQLSFKLEIFTLLSEPFIILDDTIQKLCIDRLKPWTKYTLNLSFYVEDELKKKIAFNSFLKSPFIFQKQSKVIIQEYSGYNTTYLYSFVVCTSSYIDTILPTSLFTTNAEKLLSIIDGKYEFTKRIVNLICFLVNHLQELVSLHIKFSNQTFLETLCFSNLIRQQLHQYAFSQSYQL
ncbi:unnamed protein product [Rotaria sp. Silwood1]|nr:unnamed protein product [Rotaria sp. Silwood1]